MVQKSSRESQRLVKKGGQPNLFTILDPLTRGRFVDKCKRLTFEPGRFLFMQGNEHTYSYIIDDGLIRTYYGAQSGREVTLGYWSAGDLVGGPGVFGGGYHIWSAVAARRSEVLAISGPELREFAASNAEVFPWIIDVLGFKLRWLSILFQIHGTERVQQRLAKLLLMLGEIYGVDAPGGIVITHKISQGDLATLVGASRQWTNRTLRQLGGLGLLSMKNGRITLHDPTMLKAMTGDN